MIYLEDDNHLPDGTHDFHIKFTADEDELCCLSGAIDKCEFQEGEEK